MVFYVLCETLNKNQFVLNFVVCIVLLAMDFWTVRAIRLAASHPCPCFLPCRHTNQLWVRAYR